MNRLSLIILGATAALGSASIADAATFLPGSPNFTVTGNIASGPVSAFIGNSGIAAGDFSDSFIFRIDQVGTGSGSISTSTSIANSSTDLDITSVLVNGIAAAKTMSLDGLSEFFNISDVPIAFGATNTITVTGLSRGAGSYGGNATFQPAAAAVPEPAAWAMMLVGFGAIGGAMRNNRKSTKATFA